MKSLFRNHLGNISYEDWEWRWMRLLFAPVIWLATFPTLRFWVVDLPNTIDREEPNGLGMLVPLEWLGQPVPTALCALAIAILLIFYVLGKGLPWVTTGLAVLHAAAGSLLYSPRGHHHSAQLVGMVLMGQSAWFLYHAWRKRSRKAGDSPRESATGAVFWSQQMIAAAYVVSAISKWVNSGGGWIPGWQWVQQTPNIVVQFEKNHLQSFYDSLQTPPETLNRGVMEWFGDHPWAAMLCIAPGFYLELFAFLGLFNRVAAALMGVALILLHVFIALLMHLEFRYFMATDLIFLVNLPYWIATLVQIRSINGTTATA